MRCRPGVLAIETANVYLDEDYTANHSDVAPGEYVMLAVSDTGAGMSADVVARALEPFFTTKPTGHGTGLGLSQVYGFAKQSGGHITIYSEPGIGTTVKLFLPRSTPNAAVASADPDLSGQILKGSEEILVVEDNPEVRRLVKRQLTELGYTVHEARHGPEALRLLKTPLAFDLMFTDIVMPEGMTGYELAVLAREVRPGLKILFTSGYTAVGSGHENESRASGLLLSKPYRKRDLANFVRAALTEAA
jgi:CheY-like chemotaxis protein